MTRIKAPRLIQETGIRPARMARAFLAEDYDGIGQYVKIALSRGAVTTALQARVSAGDFGGGRFFPVGTPVVIASYHGQIEVLSLGNIPAGCLETFSRQEIGQLGVSEIKEIPWQQGWWWKISRGNVDGSFLIDSVDNFDSDCINWLTSAEDLKFPFEVQVSVIPTMDPYPPTSISRSLFMLIGADWDAGTLYNNNDSSVNRNDHGLPNLYATAGLQLSYRYVNSRWEALTYDSRINSPITNWPNNSPSITGGGSRFRAENLNGKKHYLKLRVTDPTVLDETGSWGAYGKWWVEDEDEPEDWTMSQTSTNLIPMPYAQPYHLNAFVFDDFGVGESVPNIATTEWDDIILNQCLVAGFEPSPRVP